jgi:anti-sigma-K factor RskA
MNADIHGLSGAYAVDALDDVERAEFERHLGQCPECQDEVASLRAAAVELTHASVASPPAALRESVLQQIATVRPLPPLTGRPGQAPPAEPQPPAGGPVPPTVTSLESRRRRIAPITWLVAAAAAAALVIGGIAWSPWNNQGSTQQPPLSITEQVIRAKDAQRYEKDIDGARATIVRSKSLGRAVIIADNMPAAPAGKDYQIWFQDPKGAMHSAGVMPHEAKPTLSMLLNGDASRYNGVGITVEPLGGSQEPTSAPIALIAFS